MQRENILAALSRFTSQRPGLDFANYGDARAYRSESASITRDLQHARELLAAVSRRDGIGAAELMAAARSAYSGRLTIEETESDSVRISYCTGQYFPTEYRRAVCAVLASALWEYWRRDMRPDHWIVTCEDDSHARIPATSRRFDSRDAAAEYAKTVAQSRYPQVSEVYQGGLSAGDYLRSMARRELSRGVAGRYFN